MPGKEEDAMATSVKQMMEAANAAVPRITPAQAREMIAKGNTLVVDMRDAPEVEKSGKVAGAVNVSRGIERQGAQRHGLRRGLQSRRVQGLGRRRRRGRQAG